MTPVCYIFLFYWLWTISNITGMLLRPNFLPQLSSPLRTSQARDRHVVLSTFRDLRYRWQLWITVLIPGIIEWVKNSRNLIYKGALQTMQVSLILRLAVIVYMMCCQMPSRFWIYTVYTPTVRSAILQKSWDFPQLLQPVALAIKSQYADLECLDIYSKDSFICPFMMKNSGLFMSWEKIFPT